MAILALHVPPPPPNTSNTSLPSLDPESLALIAYFSLAIPRGEWSLIPSLPGANPTGLLPALKWGDVWVGGWGNVIDFVSKMGGEEWALGGREEVDNGRGSAGRGDVIA
jgi:sorting and assembly machinery component 37